MFMPNGENGTRYELNSPTQSIIRSPPVLAMSTSRPAPPYPRSSQDGLVSVVWLRPQPVVIVLPGPHGESRLSSRLSRSSPQPPHRRSRPLPPTSQSEPRSPNRASLPSVGTALYLVCPWIHCASRGPSVASKFSNQLSPEPAFESAPVAWTSRIFRSGSLASNSWNLVVAGLYPSTLPGLNGWPKSVSIVALLILLPSVP